MLQEGKMYTSQRLFLCGFPRLHCVNVLCSRKIMLSSLFPELEHSIYHIVLYLSVCLSLPSVLEVKDSLIPRG